MSEKWTIRELSPEEYPGTQLRYEVRNETDVVSLHYWEEDARQMAAFPQVRNALYDALAYIEETARNYGVSPEKDAWEQMINALQVELLPVAKEE